MKDRHYYIEIESSIETKTKEYFTGDKFMPLSSNFRNALLFVLEDDAVLESAELFVAGFTNLTIKKIGLTKYECLGIKKVDKYRYKFL